MFKIEPHIYNSYDYDNEISMSFNNRLCATFSPKEESDNLINYLKENYQILYSKIFILSLLNNPDIVLTYNLEMANINSIPINTIMVHRKKESNSLYSVNALNKLIESLNGGRLDTTYKINWNDYKNKILITQNGELKMFSTKLYKIVEI